MGNKRIEIIISELDFYLINRIRELREEATPPIAQNKLSRELGFAEGYISKVENFKERSKYNLWILNRLGRILNLNSFNDFFPSDFFQNDIVKIKIEYFHYPLSNQKGKSSFKFQVISKTPLTEEELEKWKRNKLPYCREI
ncbi:hypothetical protein OQ279_13200 [Salinimicrobium sp. MT39]|uniref:XRE family transcriptional regulator n=1 Tax=Salinimicrobium profundisediminis TaxID=2994553 RepID=A0A9X3I2M6_9FLAO|nr:hypothetical protein [Salinimicrobium profundisediminis]MCX2839107.1 hypothetical protein [Salinimicrobium profundisediminis]